MSLLSLPPELRLLIYDHIPELHQNASWFFEPPICESHTLIRQETLPIYLSHNPIILEPAIGRPGRHGTDIVLPRLDELGYHWVAATKKITNYYGWVLPSKDQGSRCGIYVLLRRASDNPLTWMVYSCWNLANHAKQVPGRRSPWNEHVTDTGCEDEEGTFSQRFMFDDNDATGDGEASEDLHDEAGEDEDAEDEDDADEGGADEDGEDEDEDGNDLDDGIASTIVKTEDHWESVCAAILCNSLRTILAAMLRGDDPLSPSTRILSIYIAVYHVANSPQYYYAGSDVAVHEPFPEPLRQRLKDNLRVILAGGTVEKPFDARGMRHKQLMAVIKTWREGLT